MAEPCADTDEAERLVWGIDQELIVELCIERAAETGHRRKSRGLQAFPTMGQREAEIWSDAFGELGFDVDRPRSIGARRVNYHSRQRHLVGDEGVGCEDRRGEKTIAGEAVGNRTARMCDD